jgi:hypothetical protein
MPEAPTGPVAWSWLATLVGYYCRRVASANLGPSGYSTTVRFGRHHLVAEPVSSGHAGLVTRIVRDGRQIETSLG